MTDLYFTESGDVAISTSGDLAVTDTAWRDDVQQAYIRVLTDAGDFRIFPELGASLTSLYGMPQSPDTGALGEQMIRSALEREGRFTGKPISIQAVPTGYQSIRFDISITSGSLEQIRLSVEQDLGVS